MSLPPGTRLGPYEILAPIGAGGMGEVYKARDTRLDRTVAVKILPGHLSGDPDRRQRFEREARAVSSLNHPNICTLHDIGRHEGVDYLVMEYLEGETLAARLARGPLPADQALRHAQQIADALDKAHRQGVIHRDLKPGNIVLSKAGAKLLDFGMARLTGTKASPAIAGLSALPTQDAPPLTAEGALVGTLPYMAPEQVEGREADARSDIFALGAVIYEMATGRRAFDGKSQASVIAAILERDPPPIAALQPMTPPALERAVKTCLAKNPEDRWQSARDLLLELRWIAEAGPPAATPTPGRERRRGREWLAWSVAVIGIAAASGLAILHLGKPGSQRRAARFPVSLPGKAAIHFMRVSPDGRYLSLTASSGGQTQVWLRPLGSLTARPLPGTEQTRYHFWSPDSRSITFFAEGKLKKVDVLGGAPQVLCDAPGSGPFQVGTWSRDGTILFNVFEAPGQEGLYRVSAAGGAATRVPILDESGKEYMVFWPHFLPDGRHFVFTCVPRGDETRLTDAGLCAASLDSGRARRLLNFPSAAEYAPPGYLLYSRGGTLFAHPFNAASLSLHDDPVRIAEGIEHYENLGVLTYSVSETGVLAYFKAGGTQARLLWKDRKGVVLGQVGPTAEYVDMRLSPDGRKLAVSMVDPQMRAMDIWIIEVGRNVTTRFTTEARDAGGSLWSPDGTRIVFTMPHNAPPFLHQKPVVGGGEEVLLPSTGTMHWPADWSQDGHFILYADRNPTTNWDLWILPLEKERKPVPFLRTRFRETQGTFSPDGRWVAFVSDESGSREVYAQPLRGPGERRRVSTAGGTLPRWRRDGRELFYLGLDNQLMAVPVKLGASFEPGTPTALFPFEPAPSAETEYDVSGDGQRFIVSEAVGETAGPPTVVLDWTADIGGSAP